MSTYSKVPLNDTTIDEGDREMDAAFDDNEDYASKLPETPKSPPPTFQSSSNHVLFNEDDELDHENEPTETSPMVKQTSTEGEVGEGIDSNIRSNGNTNTTFGFPLISRNRVNSTNVIQNVNDGVFANLMAKPETEMEMEKEQENPPPYEEAAADAAPPYWETTVITPGLMGDEIMIEGLPVGNFFSFIWNLMVSMTFQFVGFLLTYLLHTTHAAKNGSRAGLGITLVQYGFYLRTRSLTDGMDLDTSNGESNVNSTSPFPFDYSKDNGDLNNDNLDSGGSMSIFKSEYVAYLLMIVGWFLTIRSTSEWVRLRRLEMITSTESTSVNVD